MRVTVVPTGVVRGKRVQRGVRRYLPGGWSQSTLPVNAYAVEHPDGICLFDTGQSTAAAPLPGLHPYLRLARFELTEVDEAARAIDPADVRWVVLSHLHTDHVGGIAAFRRAEVIVARGEWEQASGLHGRLRGYLPQHWPNGLEPHLVEPSAPGAGPFDRGYDVAGDGRLLVVTLPGHTANHVGLLARDAESGWLLAGDAAHTAAELESADPGLGAWCAENGITILTAHDPAAASLVTRRQS